MLKKQGLLKLFDEIISVLVEADYVVWRSGFENHRDRLICADEEELRTLARKILVIRSGGAGSFNDLVISKNGRVDPVLNERLDHARLSLDKEAEKLL